MWKKTTLTVLAILTIALIVRAAGAPGASTGTDAPSVELGEHLVTILACNECHTPWKIGPAGPEQDMTRMLSGHPQDAALPDPPVLPAGPWVMVGAATNTAFAGPWGVTYAINLTPHETTGIGIWNEQMFVDAIRTGRHMGQSRVIQPPMPWPSYSRMTDHELRSIYAYLRTIPPIENHVPDYREPGPQGPDAFD